MSSPSRGLALRANFASVVCHNFNQETPRGVLGQGALAGGVVLASILSLSFAGGALPVAVAVIALIALAAAIVAIGGITVVRACQATKKMEQREQEAQKLSYTKLIEGSDDEIKKGLGQLVQEGALLPSIVAIASEWMESGHNQELRISLSEREMSHKFSQVLTLQARQWVKLQMLEENGVQQLNIMYGDQYTQDLAGVFRKRIAPETLYQDLKSKAPQMSWAGSLREAPQQIEVFLKDQQRVLPISKEDRKAFLEDLMRSTDETQVIERRCIAQKDDLSQAVILRAYPLAGTFGRLTLSYGEQISR